MIQPTNFTQKYNGSYEYIKNSNRNTSLYSYSTKKFHDKSSYQTAITRTNKNELPKIKKGFNLLRKLKEFIHV